MATLTPFDQSNLLVGVADPRVRDGICVALCDYWLALIKANTTRTPRERITELTRQAGSAIMYHSAAVGRNQTRVRRSLLTLTG